MKIDSNVTQYFDGNPKIDTLYFTDDASSRPGSKPLAFGKEQDARNHAAGLKSKTVTPITRAEVEAWRKEQEAGADGGGEVTFTEETINKALDILREKLTVLETVQDGEDLEAIKQAAGELVIVFEPIAGAEWMDDELRATVQSALDGVNTAIADNTITPEEKTATKATTKKAKDAVATTEAAPKKTASKKAVTEKAAPEEKKKKK